MKLFHLEREEDVSGVSGTGIVAQGVVFDDGTAVVRWLTETPTTTIHQLGISSVRAIHGHNGSTRIVFET